MVIERGDIWWADLGEPSGSSPAGNRPVLVVQADAFNRSRVSTVVVAAITSNLERADAPGNVLLRAEDSGLPKDSVVNVTQVVTLNKGDLTERAARLSFALQTQVDEGLRLVLAL